MTATLIPPRSTPEPDSPAPVEPAPSLPRAVWAAVVVVAWVAAWALTKGQDTLARPVRERTDLMDTFTSFQNDVIANRDTNPLIQFTYGLGARFVDIVDWLQRMVSVDNFPRPVPELGWLGVAAVATWLALAVAGWRISLLVAASFASFGLLGYWSDAMDLLIVTFVAVTVAVLIGMPMAIWIASSRRAEVVVTGFLDLMQTMPTFVYLLPIVLFFGIGASGAVVCTLIYALPPIIRIAGHGIRTVSETTIEATDSAGQTFLQRLLKVQLPMARSTIVVGLNQTIMAALAMATIAAFVNGPGLGKPVLNALTRIDIGGAFVPGMLIVVMAIMLDRTTTAASERSELLARGGGGSRRQRRLVLGAAAVVAIVAVWLSRYYPWAAEFPENGSGRWTADRVNSFADWFVDRFGGFTEAVKDGTSNLLLNPLQELLGESPWWLSGLAILALAWVFGRERAVVPTLVCLAGIRFFDFWNHAMITLTMT
ncbi:MAG TPA: ABC transporter permease subunit, partial [Cryobacterium sp.]|nr:ABC transporter permease subunit [Cryobacterium sp.]